MKKLTSLFAFIILVIANTALQAQNVDGILKNYFEAMGGVDKWKSKQNMRITGQSENMGMSFPITVYAMRPNLQKVEVNVQGQQFIDCFDGEAAWTLNPFMGGTEPTKKTDEETTEAAKQMFEDELIDYQEKGHTLTLEGSEEVDGADCYKLKMVKKSGDEVVYFIDKETSAPVMMRNYIAVGPMKGKAVDTYLSDYEEVDGVMVPFSMDQKMDGQTFMNLKATKVEFNVPMEKDIFLMPKK